MSKKVQLNNSEENDEALLNNENNDYVLNIIQKPKSLKSTLQSSITSETFSFKQNENLKYKPIPRIDARVPDSNIDSISNASKYLLISDSLYCPIFTNQQIDHVPASAPAEFNDESQEPVKSEFVYKEGGYGWLVVLASCWCFGLTIAMQNSYSVLYNGLIDEYKNATNHVFYAAWIGSSSNSIQFLSSIPVSIVIDLFQPRKVAFLGGFLSTISLIFCMFVERIQLYFLTFSFLFGIGQSLLLISTFAILPHYFSKKLGLANGLMNLGGAFLTISVPFITGESLKYLGLTKTWLVLASICSICILCSLTFKPQLPIEKTTSALQKLKGSIGTEMFTNYKFLNWSLACFIGLTGYMIPILTIAHYSSIKYPEYKIEILTIIFGGFSGISALIFGKIGDITKFSRVWFHFICFTMYGSAQILLIYVENYFQLATLVAILGTCDGIYLSNLIPIIVEIAITGKLSNQASGIYHSIISIPVVLGPALSGFFFEKFQNYIWAFRFGGFCCLFCAVILLANPGTLLYKFSKIVQK